MEASQIPDLYRGITFFGEEDVWFYDVRYTSTGPCSICDPLQGDYKGSRLRSIFSSSHVDYGGLVILDENTIGGPSANGDGLMHPNCRCRLRRKAFGAKPSYKQ